MSAHSEKRLSMISESKRLETFKKWPYTDDDECNALKLAEAGFFWTGTDKEPDSAQCFVCNKQLDGWESTDDPWEEHKNHAPQCPFVVMGKAEEFLTVNQVHELWRCMIKNMVDSLYNLELQQLNDWATDTREQILKHKRKMQSGK